MRTPQTEAELASALLEPGEFFPARTLGILPSVPKPGVTVVQTLKKAGMIMAAGCVLICGGTLLLVDEVVYMARKRLRRADSQ